MQIYIHATRTASYKLCHKRKRSAPAIEASVPYTQNRKFLLDSHDWLNQSLCIDTQRAHPQYATIPLCELEAQGVVTKLLLCVKPFGAKAEIMV